MVSIRDWDLVIVWVRVGTRMIDRDRVKVKVRIRVRVTKESERLVLWLWVGCLLGIGVWSGFGLVLGLRLGLWSFRLWFAGIATCFALVANSWSCMWWLQLVILIIFPN